MNSLINRLNEYRKSLDSKIDHNWVSFSNPRNRKIQVVACSRCGFMRTNVNKHVDCNVAAADGNKIKALGWEPIAEVA